jgi:hypothetical protein
MVVATRPGDTGVPRGSCSVSGEAPAHGIRRHPVIIPGTSPGHHAGCEHEEHDRAGPCPGAHAIHPPTVATPLGTVPGVACRAMRRRPDTLFTRAFVSLTLSDLAYFIGGGALIGVTRSS